MKKFLLSILFLLICSTAHATVWYACTSGGNWSANVWTSVMADQGTCAAALGTPVAGDTATLNSSSGNITITSAAAAAFLDETGYAGTLAFGTQTLTLTTGANLGGAMTSTSGTISDGGGTITLLSTATGSFPTLKITAATTMTAGVYTWPGALTFSGTSSQTVTLSNGGSTWTNSGQITVSVNQLTLNQNISGDSITANGGWNNSSALNLGTATVIIGGGTWTESSGYQFENNVTLAGNVTINNVTFAGSKTLTYSSGTISCIGTFSLGSSATFSNVSGMTFNILSDGGSAITLTTNSDVYATTLTQDTLGSGNRSITMAGAYNFHLNNLIVLNNGSFTFVAGQTVYISNSITAYINTIKSATASSPTYIQYTGTKANQNIFNMNFTDVQMSGNKLYNYNGNTLTRTSNIVNVNASNINPKTINYYNGV